MNISYFIHFRTSELFPLKKLPQQQLRSFYDLPLVKKENILYINLIRFIYKSFLTCISFFDPLAGKKGVESKSQSCVLNGKSFSRLRIWIDGEK